MGVFSEATAAGLLPGGAFLSVRGGRWLAGGGGDEDGAWCVLEDAEGDAVEQPGGESAAAGEAEHDQVGAPFGGLGDDLVGGPVDQCGADLLRRGETLLASRCGIDAWRILGDTGAQCLWVLRD